MVPKRRARLANNPSRCRDSRTAGTVAADLSDVLQFFVRWPDLKLGQSEYIAGSDESTIWSVAVHDLNLGTSRDYCNYIPRGRVRLCRTSLWRRHGLATRAFHV